MKIAYLSQSIIPSTDANAVHVMKMCQAFALTGHQVSLHCYANRADSRAPFKTYNIEPNFVIQQWKIPTIRGRALLLAARTFLEICFAKVKPDLIYARNIFALWMCSYIKIPIIFESHAPPRTALHRYLEKRVYRCSNFIRLVCITSALRDYYLKEFPFLSPKKIIVAADGADLIEKDFKQPTSVKLKGAQNRINIGYAGSLNPGKGVELILKIAEIMPDVNFHVIGGTQYEAEELTSPAKFAENTYFYGYVNHGELPQYLSEMDVLVAPYQKSVLPASRKFEIGTWMSPLKIFEYMSIEKPIVASRLPVLQEVLEDNHNCILCDPEDSQAWRQAIVEITENQTLANNLVKNALFNLQNKYTWNSRAKLVLNNLKNPHDKKAATL